MIRFFTIALLSLTLLWGGFASSPVQAAAFCPEGEVGIDLGTGWAVNQCLGINPETEEAYPFGETYRILPVFTPSEAPQGDVPSLIRAAALRHGLNPVLLLRIARCESGYNPLAVGPLTRTGRPKGVFQFMDTTWARTPQGQAGLSVFSAGANIEAAMWLFQREGSRPWECR